MTNRATYTYGTNICDVSTPSDNDCALPNIEIGWVSTMSGAGDAGGSGSWTITNPANSKTVGRGGKCVIAWNATSATSCTIRGPGVNSSGLRGVVETPRMGIDTAGSSVYTVTCYNGSVKAAEKRFTCMLNPEYQEI